MHCTCHILFTLADLKSICPCPNYGGSYLKFEKVRLGLVRFWRRGAISGNFWEILVINAIFLAPTDIMQKG